MWQSMAVAAALQKTPKKPSSRPSRTPTRSFISSPSTSSHQHRSTRSASSRSSKEAQLKAMELEKQKKAKLERAYELCLPTARPPNLDETMGWPLSPGRVPPRPASRAGGRF